MIRNSYGFRYWTFPGGGKKKNETPEAAARREAKEEVDVSLRDLVYLGTYFSRRQHKRDTVYCFYGKADNNFFQIDNEEVEEARWFGLEEVPKSHSVSVEEVFALYKKS
jgi:ADP-ribose pyrophosphatase YjhB (NUDIX family)